MSVNILRVDTEDLQEELDRLLWSVLWAPLGLPSDIRQQFRLPGPSLELVAVRGDRLVGGVVFHYGPGGEPELRHIGVEPGYQTSGIGRRLVQEGLRLLSDKGCRAVSTIARSTSVGFFARLGFVSVPEQVPDHPVFLKHGIRFHKMIWKSHD